MAKQPAEQDLTVDQATQQLEDALVPLKKNLRQLDDSFMEDIDHGKTLDLDLISSWYLQHLLYLAILKFKAQHELTVPHFIGRWEFCFVTSDPVMNEIWKQLIGKQNVDQTVLVPAFNRLKQALTTQMVPVEITDEITQWRLHMKSKY